MLLKELFILLYHKLLINLLQTQTAKAGKLDKKSLQTVKLPTEQRVVIATIRCALQRPDWSQPAQHFHWDDSLGTNDAIHWGDGDLSVSLILMFILDLDV